MRSEDGWQPALALERRATDRRTATKHKKLTDAIIADVDAGRLKGGQRLPTHRDLAQMLGISVQTVSISYKEAERRGYLQSEVGRGTFVRDRVTERAGRLMLDRSPGDVIDLSIVRAAYTDAHEQAARSLMAELADSDNSAWMRPCRPIAGLDRHRDAARRWLTRLGVEVPADRILITNGTAHAIFLALATVVRPGDVVLTENLTDHGVIGLANVLGFTLRGLPTDDEGILPDALDAACHGGSIAALVCIPSFGNPTSHLAGTNRRRAIAEIARRRGIFVIEDEVYKPLLDTELPSIATMLPELGFFATSFTKSVMTGLRVGYLVMPPQFGLRAASILRVSSWSGVPVVSEMATRLIDSGEAERLLTVQRTEIRARQAIAQEILGPLVAGAHPLSLSLWLAVPEHWTEDALIRALAARGVAVTPSDPFVVGPDRSGHGIRVCIGGRLTHGVLHHAAEIIRDTCAQLPPVNELAGLA